MSEPRRPGFYWFRWKGACWRVLEIEPDGRVYLGDDEDTTEAGLANCGEWGPRIPTPDDTNCTAMTLSADPPSRPAAVVLALSFGGHVGKVSLSPRVARALADELCALAHKIDMGGGLRSGGPPMPSDAIAAGLAVMPRGWKR